MQPHLQQPGGNRRPPGGSPPEFLCRALALCALLTLSAVGARAQSQDFQYLIFEPVLLEVDFDEALTSSGAQSYVARELTTLPASDPVALMDLLAARQSSATAADQATLESDIARYEQAVADLELAGGPYEPRLSQELLALGSALHRAGNYNAALAVFERASHINRVNNGLFNLEQIPIIEKSIENFLAQGDLLAADELQEYLFYLYRKSLGENSVDLLPALTRYAEWNVFAFNARAFALPASTTSDENDVAPSAPAYDPVGMEGFRTRSLITAQNIYQSIIQLLLSNFGNTDPRLPDLERQLALTNYYFATTFNMASSDFAPSATMAYSNNLLPYDMSAVANNSLGFREGRDALERRIGYMQNMPDLPPAELAAARLDLGDWLLIFKKRGGALDVYEEAFQDMREAGATAQELSATFSPALPVEVPLFLARRYSREAFAIPANVALDYQGFIDVEFSLNRFGLPGAITVLGKSADTTEFIESRLVRHLRRAQFRPRPNDTGKVRENALLRLRYYYAN